MIDDANPSIRIKRRAGACRSVLRRQRTLGWAAHHLFVLRRRLVARAIALTQPLLQATPPAIYYDLLQTIRLTGDWEAWLRFFLTGVEETASQAGKTAKALMKFAVADEKRIQTIGKTSCSALRVHRLLEAQPILSIASAGEALKLSVPTVTAPLKHRAKLGIAHETTGRNYGRIYAYDKYLKILNEGTEPLN